MIKEWIKAYREFPTDEDRRRAEICKSCDYAKHSEFLELIKGKVRDVRGLYCDLCKCPLVAKIKTKDKKHICPKWL